jgi:hypothetical protein
MSGGSAPVSKREPPVYSRRALYGEDLAATAFARTDPQIAA